MDPGFQHAVMLDDGSRVHDHRLSDPGTHVDHGVREDDILDMVREWRSKKGRR